MSSEPLEILREDDFVEYFLFPNIKDCDIQLENEEEQLQKFQHQIDGIYKNFAKNYIWHRDDFKIYPRYRNFNLLNQHTQSTNDEPLPPHLHGISHYGDNISDEWFIVSLLFEITKQLPGVIARIIDSDGEFMLIEAAEYLPTWASPMTCDKRVYISDGAIQLVHTPDTDEPISVTEALQKIRSNSTVYKISSDMENCIRARIKDYPENIAENLHRKNVYVPVGVASLLHQKPQLISSAVLAFCHRDPIDMKICKAMKYFPPENRVYTSVQFTKCLYAQLVHSSYFPDRRTGWNLPPTSNPQYASHVLGVKLACGFEILASQASQPNGDLETDKNWLQYREKLVKCGYFQDELEGSKEYTRLFGVAKDYFIENRDSMKITPKIGEEIISRLKAQEINVDELRRMEHDLPPEDNDDWLNVSPEELDEMLTKRYGVKKIFSMNGNVEASNFTSHISEFLDQKSEHDGIDVPTFTSKNYQAPLVDAPVKPKRGIKKNSKQPPTKNGLDESDSPAGTQIDFDPDAFGTQVKNFLDLYIPEDKWEESSASDMSDYDGEDNDLDKSMDDITNMKAFRTEITEYMKKMDLELANTEIGKSFTDAAAPKTTADDGFDDIESFKPVDIDMNTLKNMMESYQSQLGGPGPTSTLLGSMGLAVQRAAGEKQKDLTNTQV